MIGEKVQTILLSLLCLYVLRKNTFFRLIFLFANNFLKHVRQRQNGSTLSPGAFGRFSIT